jgi:hypothetical protein
LSFHAGTAGGDAEEAATLGALALGGEVDPDAPLLLNFARAAARADTPGVDGASSALGSISRNAGPQETNANTTRDLRVKSVALLLGQTKHCNGSKG